MEVVPLLLTLAFCIASWCYPWTELRTRGALIALQLPWAAVACYVVYELMMRKYNIRVDLMLVVPVMVIMAAITLRLYVKRMAIALRPLPSPGSRANAASPTSSM